MARNIELRSTFESKGYVVEYDDKTKNIRVYDPKTGHSAMVTPGSYNIDPKTGKAKISQDTVNRVMETISSGKYKLPGYGGSSSGSSSSSKTPTSSSKSKAPTSPSKPYEGHIKNYFGTPENYAIAIQLKEALGQPLDDPAAAEAFKRDYPHLFSTSLFETLGLTSQQQQQRQQQVMPEWAQDFMSSVTETMAGFSKALQSLQPPPLPPMPEMMQPPQIQQPETIQENVPVEGVETPQTEQPQATPEAPRTASGFVLQAGRLPASPMVSAESLYDYYKKLTGREDENVRQFLASPQFQSALQGVVPAWMAADPVWRLLLTRAGVNPRQLRLEAIRERLNKEE